MFISITSFINITFLGSVFILILWFTIKNSILITKNWIKLIFLFILVIMIRMLFPIEFSFTNTIASKNILPMLYKMLKIKIFYVGKYSINIKQILYLIWTIGTILYFIRTMIIYNRFKVILNNLPEVKETRIQNVLENISRKYNNSVTFKLIETDIVSTPTLFGIRNPTIIVPSTDFSEDDWYYIFSHEIIHYHKHHLWIKVIIEILCGIYWWNPFIFLFRKTINKLLEIDVDFTVTKNLNHDDKIKYLECLLNIAKHRSCKQSNNISLGLGNDKSSFILHRFKIIIDSYILKRKNNYKNIVFTFLPMLFSLILCFTIVFEPYHIDPKDASDTFEITSGTSYLVHKSEGGYNLYIDNEYVATINDIKDSYSNLTIYKNLKEAVKNEN